MAPARTSSHRALSIFVAAMAYSPRHLRGCPGTSEIVAVNVRRSIDIRDIGRPSGMFTKFASLPPGTIKISDNSMCAHLPGLPIEPCFRVQRIDQHSFRGSIAGSDYAYCDFYQRNPHTRLMSGLY